MCLCKIQVRNHKCACRRNGDGTLGYETGYKSFNLILWYPRKRRKGNKKLIILNIYKIVFLASSSYQKVANALGTRLVLKSSFKQIYFSNTLREENDYGRKKCGIKECE